MQKTPSGNTGYLLFDGFKQLRNPRKDINAGHKLPRAKSLTATYANSAGAGQSQQCQSGFVKYCRAVNKDCALLHLNWR